MTFVLHRVSDRPDYFEHFQIGNLTVSLQGSRMAYSIPRETLPNSDDYLAFEVALFFSDDHNDQWFHPELDERFSHCSWASYWRDDDVAPYVPRREIEKMLTDLRSAFLN